MTTIASINYIELVDDGFGGLEPVIAGRKITVHDIAAMHIMGNAAISWIAKNFDLTPAQIYAALSYYYDHKEQIDQELAEANDLTRKLGTSLDDLIVRTRQKMKGDQP